MFTDRDQVFEWLNRACDERDLSLVYVTYNEYLLGSDPRYAELLRRMGLEHRLPRVAASQVSRRTHRRLMRRL